MSVQWIKLLPNLILNTFTKNGKQTQETFGSAEIHAGNTCLLWILQESLVLKQYSQLDSLIPISTPSPLF